MIKKYRPSNGTEGSCFESAWCGSCFRYKDGGCRILCNASAWNIDHPMYPKELRYDNGHPICTAFLSFEEHKKRCQNRKVTRYARREKQGQQRLFA